MRKVIIIIIALFCLLPIADAQNIVGKWKCSKEFLKGLGTGFGNMRGMYKFKKDSTFIVKIQGGGGSNISKRHSRVSTPRRSLYIKVKGTFSVANGTITTKVKPKGVFCYIESGRSAPIAPTVFEAGKQGQKQYELLSSIYEGRRNTAKRQEKTIKTELMHMWNWEKEPIALNGDTLAIGDKATFTK